MKLPTEKQLRWREIDEKIRDYLNGNEQLKEDAPDWARELYGEWKKRLQEMRAEMDEEEKKNGSFEF